MSLDLIPAELLFSFYDATLPWLFVLLIVRCWCCHSWNSSFLLNCAPCLQQEVYSAVLLLPGFCLCVCEVEPTLLFVLLFVTKFLNLDIFSGSYNSSGWKPLCCFGGGGLYFVFVVSSLLTDCCLFSKYSPSTRACSHGYTVCMHKESGGEVWA